MWLHRELVRTKGRVEGTPDDAIEVGSPNIPWSFWTTCVKGGNVTEESRALELEGSVGVGTTYQMR